MSSLISRSQLKMTHTLRVIVVLLTLSSAGGVNIMYKKPSIQSSTYHGKGSWKAVDGRKGRRDHAMTAIHGKPYWQGDLQGFYHIHNITFTTPRLSAHLDDCYGVYVGVSVRDVRCGDSEAVTCGQVPYRSFMGQAITFTCPVKTPAIRFVRLWRGGAHLSVNEVEVEGELRKPEGIRFERFQRLLTPGSATATSTVTASSVCDCARHCKENQPCLTFSFNNQTRDNCLITGKTGAPDVAALTYQVAMCP